MDRLETLPAVDLVQVGDDYYVVDGHNRVAAARKAGGIEVDADVTQLLIPGVTQPGQARFDAASLIGTDEIRQAARGRQARAVPKRDANRGCAPTRAGRRPRRPSMTERISVRWPDPVPFVSVGGRPIRILAVSDEPDLSIDSAVTRERIGAVDLIIGAGDLEPDYLSFVADAFHAPLQLHPRKPRRRRGLEPHPPRAAAGGDARRPPRAGGGLPLLGFSGSPIYSDRGMQVSSLGMWAKVIGSWSAAHRARPVIVVTHAPPREGERRRRSRAPWVHRLQVAGRPSRAAALAARPHGARATWARRPHREAQRHALLQLHRCHRGRAPSPRRRWMSRSRFAGPPSGAWSSRSILAAIALVVRLAIFSAAAAPRRHGGDGRDGRGGRGRCRSGGTCILSRSRGWSGERDAGDGRVQVAGDRVRRRRRAAPSR